MSKDHENESNQSPAKAKVSAPSSTKKTAFVKILVCLIVAILAGFTVFYLLDMNNRLDQQLHGINKQFSTLKQQQELEKIQFSEQLLRAEEKQTGLVNHLQKLEHSFNAMNQQPGYHSDDWLLFNTRYYLELAAINAKWSQDREKTTALLQQADMLLASTHDPRVLEIRHTLREEIAQCETKKNLDVMNILSQLLVIDHRLDEFLNFTATLPLASSNPKQSVNDAISQHDWKTALNNSLEELKSFVVIHHREGAEEAILSQTELRFKIASIKLYLQEAEWAVINQNAEIYQMALQQALNQIASCQEANAALASQLSTRLEQLLSISWPSTQQLSNKALIQLDRLIAETHPAQTHPISRSTSLTHESHEITPTANNTVTAKVKSQELQKKRKINPLPKQNEHAS